MTSGFQITCVNKNRLGVIFRVAGDGWSMSIRDAIAQLASERIRLVVLLDNKYVEVGVRSKNSDVYLALEPDGTPLDELEGLPSC